MTRFGPIIVRVAAWPIESLLEIASPRLASRVDAWLETLDGLQRAADALCDELFTCVPAIPDRAARGAVLALRRALHRSLEPAPADTLALVLHRCNLSRQVLRHLAQHNAARKSAVRQRERLRQTYGRAIAKETQLLRREASRPDFRRALVLASPSTSSAWERVRGDATVPLPAKLLETLSLYLARAVGRATPNGLWAGVALASEGPTRGGHPLESTQCGARALAQPNLAAIHRAVEAMWGSERCRTTLGWRLNPSLHRTSGRRWRFLRQSEAQWGLADAYDDGLIVSLVRAAPAEGGAFTAAEWADAAGIAEHSVRDAIRVQLLRPAAELGVNQPDAWKCLDDFLAALPMSELEVWNEALSRLRRFVAQLERPHAMSFERFRGVLNGARDTVNALLMRYGAAPLDQSQAVLLVDVRAPFAIRVKPALRKSIERVVEAFWKFDRFGIGEMVARADAKAQATTLPESLRAIAGFEWRTRRGALRRRQQPQPHSILGSWEHAIEGVSEARVRDAALRRLTRWAATLRRNGSVHSVLLSQTQSRSAMPLTPGSALFMLRRREGARSIRIGSVSPDCGTFYGRFHALFERTAEPAFRDWLIAAREFAQHHGGVMFGDLAPSMSPNNAALRPPSSTVTIEPFRPGQTRFRVDYDRRGRLRFRDRNGRRVLPTATTAVDLSRADPISAWLATQAALIGRPSLLRPSPPLAMEIADLKRSPELCLDRQAIVQPRRWFLPRTFFVAGSDSFERFLSWRRYVRDAQLPELLYARTRADDAEFLMVSTSCLSVESLYSAMRSADGLVQLQESFQTRETMLVRDDSGHHYVTEVAVAWRGDRRFWRQLR